MTFPEEPTRIRNWQSKLKRRTKDRTTQQHEKAELSYLLFPEEPIQIRNWAIKIVVEDKGLGHTTI